MVKQKKLKFGNNMPNNLKIKELEQEIKRLKTEDSESARQKIIPFIKKNCILRSNNSGISVIIDFKKSPEKSKVANISVEARLNFIKSELNGKYPLLIYSRTGMRALSEKYGFLLGRDYQASVSKKYGSDKKLLEEIAKLID